MRTVHRYAYGAHLAPPPPGPSCPAPQVGTARRRQARVARTYSAGALGRACEHRWGYRRAGSPVGDVGLRLCPLARGLLPCHVDAGTRRAQPRERLGVALVTEELHTPGLG